MENKDHGDSGFWTGLIIGGLIGGAAALLFTPRAGRQVREQIVESSSELSERARTTAQDVSSRARETAAEIAARSRSIIEEGKITLEEAMAEGKEEATRVTQELQTRFEETRAKGLE